MSGVQVSCLGHLTQGWEERSFQPTDEKTQRPKGEPVFYWENTISVDNGKGKDYLTIQTNDQALCGEFGKGSDVLVSGSLVVNTKVDEDYVLARSYKPVSEDRRKKDHPTKTFVKIRVTKLKKAPTLQELYALASGSNSV